jgi:FkbM family methyltransferase
VDVGANEPWKLSLTAALYQLGWRGLLVEADPLLASELRLFRPEDLIAEVVASNSREYITFYRVLGTGLGTLSEGEADAARTRGFEVEEVVVEAAPLDDLLDLYVADVGVSDIHFMSIDVEGAEKQVLDGLSLQRHRPWVLCIEAVEPGLDRPSYANWERGVLESGYRFVAFDGVNRWYVDERCADSPVAPQAGAPAGTTIAEAIATPFHVIDAGAYGWQNVDVAKFGLRRERQRRRHAWQREVIRHEWATAVPTREYLRQIEELRTALITVQGSRTYRMSRGIANFGARILSVGSRLRVALPRPLAARMTRERHLRHVTINMSHLTHPAYLGQASEDRVSWASGGPRPPLPKALAFGPIRDLREVSEWLAAHPFDSDEDLDARMDNFNDEVGRVQRALRTRVRLQMLAAGDSSGEGGRVAFDARCLQTSEFGQRGIGRFARAALAAVRASAGDERVTLIVDPGLTPLPGDVVGDCPQVRWITREAAASFGALIQPSPMTHSPDPLIHLLRPSVRSLAIVYDFIPLHYPMIYLAHAADRAEYVANLDALRHYNDYVCISHSTRDELTQALVLSSGDPRVSRSAVAWPRALTEGVESAQPGSGDGSIVIMTGDEPRKNTFGGLAGVAAATCDALTRDVVVVGMAGQDDRVHHWSIAAAMRPGEVATLGRVSDSELHELLAQALCVVVPTFDEGLSLPVIEAVRAGAPVVASDVPSHRELIGTSRLCDPRSPRSLARAVRRAAGNRRLAARQHRALLAHSHVNLEEVVGALVAQVPLRAVGEVPGSARVTPERLRIGVLTPWTPQRSGVADFSATVFQELAKLADVSVYSTAGALVSMRGIESLSMTEVFQDPEAVQQRHDVVVAVVGNSHLHLPIVQALGLVDAVVVAHDTRMVEFYLALRDLGGVGQVMRRTLDPGAPAGIQPPLDEQIADMRLLQNAGMWEVARRARRLVMHAPGAQDRIESETGVIATVLPFANQRVPVGPVDLAARLEARSRVGIESSRHVVHLGTFGYVDTRTKLTDVVLEAAGWLAAWGHPIALHVVGSASAQQRHELSARAHNLGLASFDITGFQTEEEFRSWLLAIDLGVQLRVSPLLGVSGPLSDLAAFGTPAVASQGLCRDVGAPSYIRPLPDAVSPVSVAEAIEAALASPMDDGQREVERAAYRERMSPRAYAQRLLDILMEAVT